MRTSYRNEADLKFEAAIKIVVTALFCLFLMFAAYKAISDDIESHYNVVMIEGKEYSELDHDIYIDPSEKFVTIDGKRYGWSWVQSIVRKEKK